MALISSLEIAETPVANLIACASASRILDISEEETLERVSPRREDARDSLVRAHLRVAVDEAIRARGLGTRQDRLVRTAARALVEAAPLYDPSTEGRFRDYARRIVRRAIERALAS